eukprot:1305338-Rhodomonas_salina.1
MVKVVNGQNSITGQNQRRSKVKGQTSKERPEGAEGAQRAQPRDLTSGQNVSGQTGGQIPTAENQTVASGPRSMVKRTHGPM